MADRQGYLPHRFYPTFLATGSVYVATAGRLLPDGDNPTHSRQRIQ